jgi:hypothetical protein
MTKEATILRRHCMPEEAFDEQVDSMIRLHESFSVF